MVHMFSSYQVQATSYANLSLGNAHAMIDDLHARAARLAPRFEYETAEAGCTNIRPGNDEPRRQQVWDMLAEALAWNLIADDQAVVDAAIALERDGVADYQAANEHDWETRKSVVAIVVGFSTEATGYAKLEEFRTLVVNAGPDAIVIDASPDEPYITPPGGYDVVEEEAESPFQVVTEADLATYQPRPSKIRGRQAVDAFDTCWLVVEVTGPNRLRGGFVEEHHHLGWYFGHSRGQQVCFVEPTV